MPDSPAQPDHVPDRRSFPRAIPLLDVAVQCRLDGTGANVATGLADVSIAGCQVLLTDRVAPGRALAPAFRADARRAVVRVTGRAAWSRPDAGGCYAAGVAFDRPLAADDLALLAGPGPGPIARPLAAARS